MPRPLCASSVDIVKDRVLSPFAAAVDGLTAEAEDGATLRELEQQVWDVMLVVGSELLGHLLGLQCLRMTQEDILARGLGEGEVRLRMDQDYYMTINATMGAVTFPLFAYRDLSPPFPVTRTPARAAFPLREYTMSSELLLEWETRLGSDWPFRRAEESMTFFTHGAVTVEDTTIRAHMLAVGDLVDRDWCYVPVDKIEEILRERATRDLDSGKPVIYASTDGEMLRRFVDESWDAQWKQASGVRLWCVDRYNGAILHLGGEYTWGDWRRVREVFQWLIDSGRLPADGDYGDGLVAQIVMPTDGAKWIRDRILPLFAPHAHPILDPYHAMKHLGDYARIRNPRDKAARHRWLSDAGAKLLGAARRPKKVKTKKRKGHKRPRRAPGQQLRPPDVRMPSSDEPARGQVLLRWLEEQADELRGELKELKDRSPKSKAVKTNQELLKELEGLIAYIDSNVFRMDYVRYRARGYQIGSGAMESLHRGATQIRVKLPGPGWEERTSQAVFNIRMMVLAGRWEEFWSQPNLTEKLVAAFAAARQERQRTLKEAA